MGPRNITRAAVIAAALLVALTVALSLSGCPRPIPPPQPPTDFDGGAATCETACARLRQLGCRAGDPTPKGAPCDEVCTNANASGLIHWDLPCLTRASACDATDRCSW